MCIRWLWLLSSEATVFRDKNFLVSVLAVFKYGLFGG